MQIVETGVYGKALVLDGKWQSCTGDEFVYHEPLVHPAFLAHGSPKRVLVLGGGEGATVREALRWSSVEQVTMVDIDGEVVEACKEHLPEMHQGAFEDPRTDVVIGDALAFLDEVSEPYDVIISDLSDPIEEGPSFMLFTKETFERGRRALAPGGIYVLQAGPVAPVDVRMHAKLVKTLSTVWKNVVPFCSYIPTYATPWGFAMCSDRELPRDVDPESIDDQLAAATRGGLRYVDGPAMRGLLHPPAYIRKAIVEETEVYTMKQPPRFFGQR
jgi:spermidine synthase